MENDLNRDPTDLLGQLAADRAGLADRMRAPWWLPVGFGLLAAGFVAEPALPGPGVWLGVALVIGLALLAHHRRTTGIRLHLLPTWGTVAFWAAAVGVLFLLSSSFALVSFDLNGWVVVPAVLAFALVAWATTAVTTAARNRMLHGE